MSTLEDSEEFIKTARENFSGLSKKKLIEMLTYTGMFHENGTLKKEFR